jgi:hypothetical protein
MKIFIVLALFIALATAQRYAVIEAFTGAGCTDVRKVWASVELGKCVSVGGRSGKIECDGTNMQAWDCASANCDPSSCRAVQQRPTGCLSEQGQHLKLTCGSEPQANPRDVIARLAAGATCSANHIAKVAYPGGCVSGPNFSSRAACASNFYRYEQFSSQDCSGTPSSRFAWPAGCTRIPLPGSDLSVDLPKCDSEEFNLSK